jgi:hypothetical protein
MTKQHLRSRLYVSATALATTALAVYAFAAPYDWGH